MPPSPLSTKLITLWYTYSRMPIIETAWVFGSAISLLSLGALGCCCSEQQQQQILNVGDDDKPKRVCPECGLENPREANHCGDCGFSFQSDGGDNNG